MFKSNPLLEGKLSCHHLNVFCFDQKYVYYCKVDFYSINFSDEILIKITKRRKVLLIPVKNIFIWTAVSVAFHAIGDIRG